ncbi:MAG: SpoVR family protein [Phycisphaerae bacterium]|nr:SpoVR family protein [Phycisphaerae bacterium]
MPTAPHTTLPTELVEWAERIAEFARREQLDFYPVLFELLNFDQISQVAAYGGFPQRYPHWRFGMEYEKLRKQNRYGLGKIYEMVINNDPCYAYLLDDNAHVDHKTVMAHVYAHCDFFKNNVWFSKTNRRMIDEMANHATRIRRYIERYGLEKVERFIDTCLALENLIDPHSVFIHRRRRRASRQEREREREIRPEVARYPAKGYMDRYINPPEVLEKELQEEIEKQEESHHRFPVEPARDVMLFLSEHATMEDWQADVLAIIREEAYYFAPQGQTKIMNEGWASYWHSTIMTRYCLEDSELITYCEHNAGTLATSPGRLNPYKMGVELFRDIERRWDTGRHGLEYDRCDNMQERRNWGKGKPPPEHIVGKGSPGRAKIFEVRVMHNDVTFIDEFLTPEFVEDHKLYHYRYDPATGRMVVVNRDFDVIKQQMLFMLTNHAQPYIYVLDGNYRNRGELYLGHKHCGIDLEIKTATETLKNIFEIWKRPVHIHALIDEEPMLFAYDGKQPSQQRIDKNIDEPANSFTK